VWAGLAGRRGMITNKIDAMLDEKKPLIGTLPAKGGRAA
jgi:hypothetical protein